MQVDTQRAVAQALGSGIASTHQLTGGSINNAFAVRLDDQREVFVKTNPRADPRMFPTEALGLAWLNNAEAIRVPRVLAVSDSANSSPAFLALEFITSASPASDFAEQLGHGLTRLHASGADGYGLNHDNFIGTLAQDNAMCATWAEFYGVRRIEPQVRLAVDRGVAPTTWTQTFGSLLTRLPDLVGSEEPPARLHGDLWTGNLHTDDNGSPCIIDPAAYGGHREIDLAMLKLFGTPSERFDRAYNEVLPLAAGASDRVPLYQVYPLLVHANLFGGHYVSAAEQALAHYA
ncbi:MAG: fructosamine kinase family protein [Acidobacteriota bacterium]|nr:fructosamine kinase family protein [Acidobacteriota bacterium]